VNGVELPIALPWASFALSWVSLALLAMLCHRLFRGSIARLEPGERASALFALAMLPLVAALLSSVLGFAPHIGGVVVDEHCHDGTGCAAHVPILQAGTALAIAWTAGILALTGWIGVAIGTRLNRSLAPGRTLAAIAARTAELAPGQIDALVHAGSPNPAIGIVESHHPFAYCAGLLRHRLILSRALLESLSREELEAVVVHELQHAKRYDNLRRLLAAVSLWPLPRRWRNALLADLATATESACDRAAAATVGDAAVVARAIRAVSACASMAAVRPASAFGTGDALRTGAADERLRQLAGTAPANRIASWVQGVATAVVYTAVTLTTTVLAHHAVEFFVL
jgi:beta-lactamase regulating signal transducer with metallopeptidase domain